MVDGFRKVLRLIEPRARTRWLLLFVLALAVSAAEVLGAFLIFLLLRLISSPDAPPTLPVVGSVDRLLPRLDHDDVVAVVAAAIAVFFLLRGGLYLLQSYLQNRVAQNTGVQLASKLLRGYLRMPYEHHVQRNPTELTRTVYSSVAEIVASVLGPAVAVVAESLLVLGVFTALLVVAPGVTLATSFVIALLVALTLKVVQPRMATLGATNQETLHATLKLLQQSLEGIREIKVLEREAFFEQEFSRQRALGARSVYLRNALLDAPRAVIESVLVVMIVAFLVISTRSSAQPEQLLAVLGLFAYAVLRVLPSVNRIVANANTMRFGTAAIDLVLSDLDALDTSPWPPSPAPRALPFVHEIHVDAVSFRYSPTGPYVLKDVDLRIRRGESVGIVGATGAGKSTLLDILLGLLVPTQGALRVDGQDVREDVPAWHRNLGVVPQSVFLVDDTLRRNIALGQHSREIDDEKLRAAVRTAQLEPVLEQLPEGLDTVVGERGIRLSGGQRQRVAIARALYRDPSVLVFDEGTSALDNLTEAAFTRALEASRGQRTMITVAHRLSTVRRHDRIVLLSGGAVVDIGSYDELQRRSPLFREMAG